MDTEISFTHVITWRAITENTYIITVAYVFPHLNPVRSTANYLF
jgi:hypothetical protein